MDFPEPDFIQALLGNSSKWRIFDPSGVVNTRTDVDGFTDILTTATAGTFYLTMPIVDSYLGVATDASAYWSYKALCRQISGWGVADQLSVGTSSTEDPAAGLFDDFGLHWRSATTRSIGAGDDAGFSVSGGTPVMDAAYVLGHWARGRGDFHTYGRGFDGETHVNVRTKLATGDTVRNPAFLMVRITRATAAITTLRLNAAFLVMPSTPNLTVSSATATDNRGRVWFYPDDDGTLEEVDIKSCWSSLDELPMVNRRTSRSYAGRRASAILGGNFQVRATYEMFNDDDVLTGLFAAQNQLYRGRTIALCANASKAWAGYAIQPPRRGDTTVRIAGTGNTFAGSGSLSAGDFVVIQTVDEDPITELVKVTSVSNQRSFGVSAGVKHTFPRNVPILVRQRYYWPALWLDERQNSNELLTTDHGLNYTFDALLTEDLGTLQRLVDLGGSGLMTGISPSPSSRTFTSGTKSSGLTRFRFR